MKITFASEDEETSILSIEADAGETIRVGQVISIELIDGTFAEREIVSMEQGYTTAKRYKTRKVDHIEGGETAQVTVENLNSGLVRTTNTPSLEEMEALNEEMERLICLTPYKEIQGGDESIYDHVREGYTVPDKVIAYLKMTKPYVMCLGIYEHPFKEGVTLSGPYLYGDGTYCWDRDTWKYVVKYGLELPQEFIDHVMSEEGTRFMEEQMNSDESWAEEIRKMKEREDMICLLPDNAGDKELEDF